MGRQGAAGAGRRDRLRRSAEVHAVPRRHGAAVRARAALPRRQAGLGDRHRADREVPVRLVTVGPTGDVHRTGSRYLLPTPQYVGKFRPRVSTRHFFTSLGGTMTMSDLSRRSVIAGGIAAAAAGAAAGSARAASSSSPAVLAGENGWVTSTMARMTLEEKVGQLFIQNVYGKDATTPDSRNLPLYGVASPAEVVQKYHLGGVIYFASDCDVNVNPLNPVIGTRSFSSRPELAAQLAAAQVAGYQRDGRVASCAKHFPGHGDTATDSHVAFPVITHSREQ